MKNKKSIVFLVLLLLMGIIGTTYAYFTQSKIFDNKFSIKKFDVVIEETFDENSFFGCMNRYSEESIYYVKVCNSEVNKDVFVVNKEDVPAVVRISYNEEFVYDGYSDNDYRELFDMLCSDSGECFSVNNSYSFTKVWTQDFFDNWYFHEGWYYYKKVLSSQEKVQILDAVKSTEDIGIYGDYNLDFNIEAVQASSDAVKELWNQDVTINDDGTVYWEFE